MFALPPIADLTYTAVHMDANQFGVDGRFNTVARIVTNAPLLKSMQTCPCGNRTVDVGIFLEHANWKAACTACGAVRSGYVRHEILGEEGSGRPARFEVNPTERFLVFKRDGFRCVHCNHAAQRSGRTSDRLDAVLLRELGADYDTLRTRDLAEHARSCASCGQMLPGIYQTIPYAEFARLSTAAKAEIERILEDGRLSIDHLIAMKLLETDGVVREGPEENLVSKKLLVTACSGCNWGRLDALEPFEDIIEVLKRTVYGKNPRGLESVRGHLAEIYLRATLHARKMLRAI